MRILRPFMKFLPMICSNDIYQKSYEHDLQAHEGVKCPLFYLQ